MAEAIKTFKGEPVSDRRRTLIFINIVFTCVAASLLSTALTVAIEPISQVFQINETTTQWLTSGYNLAMGITMPLTAFLVRRFKTKYLYLFGIGIYIIGLIVALVSPGFSVLMVGRVFQACGNGVLLSMSQVVILSIYPPEKKGSAMGWYGLALTAAPVIAPTLSGVLVDTGENGWRLIFAVVLVIMAAAFIMAILVMGNVLDTEALHFDTLSFILSIFAFGGITLGIGNISAGITSLSVWPVLLVGIIGLVLFLIRQVRESEPFLNVKIFKSRDYTLSVIGNMLLYFVMYGGSVMTPLYFQQVMGQSATTAGLYMLPGSLAIAIISPFAGKIYDKVGIKLLFVVGSAAMLVSNLGMGMLTVSTPLWVMSILYCIRSLCIGFMLTPLVTWGTSCVQTHELSDATAIINSFRTIAGSIGSAVFVAIMSMIAATQITANEPSTAEEQLANMSGMDGAYFVMSAFTLILLIIAVFFVRNRKKDAAPEA